MFSHLRFGLAFSLCAAGLFARTPIKTEPWADLPPMEAIPAAVLEAAKAFPAAGEPGILDLLEDVAISIDEGGRRERMLHSVYRIDTEAAKRYWDRIQAVWRPWYEDRPVFQARIIGPDGTVTVLDPATIGEFAMGQEGTDVFEERKQLSAPLPNLQVGSVVELVIRSREHAAFFGSGANGSQGLWEHIPILHSRVVVEAPASSPFSWKVEGLPGVQPLVRRSEGRVRITLDPGRTEAVPDREKWQDPESALPPALRFTTFRSWMAIAKGYSDIVDRQIADLVVPEWAKAALDTPATPREMVERLLPALHRNIRYVALEFGQASLIPRTPRETVQRGYGDCKDKSTLLVALLRHAGIPADLVLLSAGFDRDMDPGMPGMVGFNHAMVRIGGDDPFFVDATAGFAKAGVLPFEDQDRAALVIRPDTVGLVRTPSLKAADNVMSETLDIVLADDGCGRVLETTTTEGPKDMDYRAYYAGKDDKARRESTETYLKDEYHGTFTGLMEIGDPWDLGRPFTTRMEAKDSTEIATGWDRAAVEFHIWSLFRDLRRYLELVDDKGDHEPPARRTPLRMPECYRRVREFVIAPPTGYGLAGLPGPRTHTFGPATLSEIYKTLPDGRVSARFTLDTGTRVWMPEDVEAARKAIIAFGKTDLGYLTFEQNGQASLNAGRMKEALAAFRDLSTHEPRKAAHLARYARALLKAGLGEAAREKAREAVKLEPGSVLARTTLGFVLQHDLVGRRFGEGWDPEGSLAAYKAAESLKPDDIDIHAEAGWMLEHNARGQHYLAGANLDEAIREYRYLRDTLKFKKSDENLLAILGWSEKFPEALDLALEMPSSPLRNCWIVAAGAVTQGSAKALEQAKAWIPKDGERRAALGAAGEALMNLRYYPQAVAFLKAQAEGMENASQVLGLAEVLSATRRRETLSQDPEDPCSVAAQILASVLLAGPDLRRDQAALSRGLAQHLFQDADRWNGTRIFSAALRPLQPLGLRAGAQADIALSLGTFTLDGAWPQGCRVKFRLPGGSDREVSTMVLVREDGRWVLAAFGGDDPGYGIEALRRLETGDLQGARLILDWARDLHPRKGGDDPFAELPFTTLWTRGKPAPPESVRAAAAALLIWDRNDDRAPTLLAEALQAAPENVPLCAALVQSRWTRKDYAGMESPLGPLMEACPDSEMLWTMRTQMEIHLHRWKELLADCDKALQLHPDSFSLLGARKVALIWLGDGKAEQAWLEGRVKQGIATYVEFNDLAWADLIQGTIGERSFQYARTSASRTPEDAYVAQHTLACLLAETGQTGEALEMVVKAMEGLGEKVPDSDMWYVFGRIAEQLGETEWARRIYGRVLPPDKDSEGAETASTHALAARRLKALG